LEDDVDAKPSLFSIRCAVLALLLFASNARAMDVSPSPSTDGS
jgi:hypothetical protein